MARLATQLPSDFADYIGLNAGVLLSEFSTEDWSVSRDNIVGATTGGVSFTDTPSWTDFGEDIDNCPKNMMELKQVDSREIKLSGTFVSADSDAFKTLVGTADVAEKVITPRDTLTTADFKDLWFVFDYGEDNAVALKLENVLSTGGLSIQTADKGKAQYSFEYTAHYSMADPTKVPYKVYFKE